MDRVREQLFLSETTPHGEGVRVAVLDSGIDPDHPDLVDRFDLASSRTFTSTYTDLLDRSSHGTHVAGIIGGSGAASNGVYRGIAPKCTLLVFKIAHLAAGLEASAAAAVEAAIDAGAHIINYSHGIRPRAGIYPPPWTWSPHRSVLEDALRLASERGILSVVAAGNEGPAPGSITRPGGLKCVLTVGALGLDQHVWPNSSQGPYRTMAGLRAGEVVRYDHVLHQAAIAIRKPDVVVPGERVTAPASRHVREVANDEANLELQDPLYVAYTGTSHATAVMSGLAACLLALAWEKGVSLGANPGQTLRRIIAHSARPLEVGTVSDFGSGSVIWPILQATLADYATDPEFRAIILEGAGPRLL